MGQNCYLAIPRALRFAAYPSAGRLSLASAHCDLDGSRLASTMRYLRPGRGEKVQAQVEALWA
jgi:hypothetical protein